MSYSNNEKCDLLPGQECSSFKVTRQVRISLALFAATNFLLGMGVFMFFVCSSAPDHVRHLSLLFSSPGQLFDELSEKSEKGHAHH